MLVEIPMNKEIIKAILWGMVGLAGLIMAFFPIAFNIVVGVPISVIGGLFCINNIIEYKKRFIKIP